MSKNLKRVKNIPYWLLAGLLSTWASLATTPLKAQDTVMGIAPVDDIQESGSDAASAEFNAAILPDLLKIVEEKLSERNQIDDLNAYKISASDLRLSVDTSLRAYFIGEGAGYRNTFGFYTGDSTDRLSGDAQLIFPDASQGQSYLGYSWGGVVDTGDYVDLGTYNANTDLNLFLIANGANGGTNTYFTDMSLNADGVDHFVMLASPETSYLLIGVEDLYGGGDQDYNDLVVALEIGSHNVTALISNVVPLPAPVWALLAMIAWLYRTRIRQLWYSLRCTQLWAFKGAA